MNWEDKISKEMKKVSFDDALGNFAEVEDQLLAEYFMIDIYEVEKDE